ncbi:hypothetical protein [Pseudactinotalea sp. Z1748]|uniref:hypothetical protein n=1 Tax=Pseudactinotalea sp. Z1748 TaxID=3413027 RepID=UPI003C7C8708
MAPTKRVSKVKVLTVDDTLPAHGAAAALVLTLLRLAKADTWQELTAKITAGDAEVGKALAAIHLDPDQLELLSDHSATVHQVASGSPRRTIALCAECGQHVVVAGKNPPSKCAMTLLCEGTYSKVSPAKATEVRPAKIAAGDDGPLQVVPAGDESADLDRGDEAGGEELGDHLRQLEDPLQSPGEEDEEEFDFS